MTFRDPVESDDDKIWMRVHESLSENCFQIKFSSLRLLSNRMISL